MKEAVNKMTQEVKSYFAKINRENNPNYIFKIHLSDQSQENLSINSLFDIDISDEEELNLLRQKAQEELKKYAANSLTDLEPSKHSEVSFKIELTDPNMKPIRCKMRPIAHNLKDKVKQALAEQEAAGIIRKSFSAWSAPLKFVHKPDGTIRITVDYSPQNKVIKQDAYPFPNIAEIYKRLSESGVFSKIDLKAAYHQIPVEFWSIQFTAFICEFGLYEYVSMPMGIKTAPAWFQRFMEATFADFIKSKVVEVYLDDTIVHTLNMQQRSCVLEKVFERIKERNIKILYEKLNWYRKK